jgi:hypothetical protein
VDVPASLEQVSPSGTATAKTTRPGRNRGRNDRSREWGGLFFDSGPFCSSNPVFNKIYDGDM